MKRLRMLVLLCALACVVVVVALAMTAWLAPAKAPITLAHYERIRLGMTEAEVTAILGCPPGDHCGAYTYGTAGPEREGELPLGFVGRPFYPDGSMAAVHPDTAKPITGLYWMGNEGWLVVWFGEDGRVIERRYYYGFPESRLQYLRRHYGW